MTVVDFVKLAGKFDLSRFPVRMEVFAWPSSVRDGGVVVHAHLHTNDVHTGFPTVVNAIERFTFATISKMSEKTARDAVAQVVRKCVDHEIRECTWFDGKQLEDPHAIGRLTPISPPVILDGCPKKGRTSR